MATNFISILNRLPIYSRPKEPAIGLVIGNPVLIESTNPNLPAIPIPQKYDHFGNLTTGSTHDLNGDRKNLPSLPGERGGYQTRTIPYRLPSPPLHSPLFPESPSPPPLNQSSGTKATQIHRKPAPPTTVYTVVESQSNPAYKAVSDAYSFQQRWDDGYFGRGGSAGGNNRVQGHAGHAMLPPSPPHHHHHRQPTPPKHQATDDGFRKRGGEYLPPPPPPPPPLKVHGKTTSNGFPKRTSSAQAPQIDLRKSAFAPLYLSRGGSGAPGTGTAISGTDGTPPLPLPMVQRPQGPRPLPQPQPSQPSSSFPSSSRIPIPKDAPSTHISKTYLPSPTEDILQSLASSIPNLPPVIPPVTPPPEPSEPKDHITLLEESREQMVARRISINREIDRLQLCLDPTGSNPHSTTSRRVDIKDMIEIKRKELTDVEKEIFDVGMMIYRAHRRRNKTEGVEGPTHLWIYNVMKD